jgi:hypothetical protein
MSDTSPPTVSDTAAASADISQELQPYAYTPLDHDRQIRILVIQPGEGLEIIKCELVPVSLDDGIEYIALSYAWYDQNALTQSDDRPETERIIIDDEFCFEITVNLASALRRLRLQDSIMLVWADAVCINQGDLGERSEQVRLMRSVYEKAGQVVIWLGEPTQVSKLAVKLVENAEKVPAEDLAATVVETKGEARNIKLFHLAMMDLFGRPWWHRLWIVQEVAVPRTDPLIAYGGAMMSWSAIETLERVAYHSDKGDAFWILMNSSGMGIIRELISIRRSVQKGESISVSKLLIATIRRECSQPLDQVYALLGLAPEATQRAVTVNYTTELEQLFAEVAKVCIEIEGSLNLLSSVQRSYPLSPRHLEDWQLQMLEALREEEVSRLNLPSWMPDWSIPYNQRLTSLHCDGCYQASKGASIDASVSDDFQRLTAAGILFDSIRVVHTAAFDAGKIRVSMMSLIDTLTAAVHLYIVDPQKREVALSEWLWRTLIANQSPAGKVPAPNDFGLRLNVFCRWAEVPDSFEPDLKEKATPLDRWSKYVGPLIAPINATMGHRRFFVTQQGYFGVGPQDMELGDAVCVLFGADMPFILREKEDHWSLVGECYVHGIMNGEVMTLQRERPQKFPVVKFSIT